MTWIGLGVFIWAMTILMGLGDVRAWLGSPANRILAVLFGLVLLFCLALGLGCIAMGINALRPVLLDDTSLRLPRLSLRTGFSHLVIPLDDVAGVEMVYCREVRNQHWRLSVIRLHHTNMQSESLTSYRSEKRGVSGTPAGRAVDALRQALPAR